MKKVLVLSLILLTSLAAMSCKHQKVPVFKIDFSGQDMFYQDADGKQAKAEYKAGERVLLYFDFIATDTNYYFYMDDKEFNPGWDSDRRAYVIDFVMPERDVKLRIESKNSMRYDPSERLRE